VYISHIAKPGKNPSEKFTVIHWNKSYFWVDPNNIHLLNFRWIEFEFYGVKITHIHIIFCSNKMIDHMICILKNEYYWYFAYLHLLPHSKYFTHDTPLGFNCQYRSMFSNYLVRFLIIFKYCPISSSLVKNCVSV
jgi:hypothetical protein